MIKNIKACTLFFTYNPTHFLQISTCNHGKKYKNRHVHEPKQKFSLAEFFKMSFACFPANGISDITRKKLMQSIKGRPRKK
jgi:hypothetical protein